MRLRLVQLPSAPAGGLYPTYQLAAAVQELVRRDFLRTKSGGAAAADGPGPPPPTVLAFTPQPTFTLGRRQHLETLGAAAVARLRAPLTVGKSATATATTTFVPAIVPSLRGGLTTYHGPGQVVLWPVLDLKAAQLRQAWTVRAYSRLLETTTAAVLGRRFGVAAHTTADPGLWVGGGGETGRDEERKIAALGVHLRRNISALGVAVNLAMPVTRGGDSNGDGDGDDTATSTNPWRRFVPCGLTGKGVTCVAAELGSEAGAADLRPAAFAAEWAATFAGALGLGSAADGDEGVDRAEQAAVQQLVEQGYAMLAQARAAEAGAAEDGQPRGATADDERYRAWVAGGSQP